MVKNHSDRERGNPLPPHGLFFPIRSGQARMFNVHRYRSSPFLCPGQAFRLAARVLLCAPSHRQDSTYNILWYTSRGALAGTRNSSMDRPSRIDPTTHRTIGERSYYGATSRSFTTRPLNLNPTQRSEM